MGTFLTLDLRGIVLAVVMGLLILLFGGFRSIYVGVYLLLVLFLFLVLSAIVTRLGRKRKGVLHVYERSRGWRNVLANGIVPLLVAFIYFVNGFAIVMPSSFIIVSYVAAVAAITADKFASEIGVLDGEPRNILTFKRLRKGVSGGITGVGLLAGLFASFVVGLTLFPEAHFAIGLAMVLVCGFFGNIVDSVFGVFEEKGVGSKYTTNIMCALAAWLLSLALLYVVFAA